jgi:hypothetical protein
VLQEDNPNFNQRLLEGVEVGDGTYKNPSRRLLSITAPGAAAASEKSGGL